MGDFLRRGKGSQVGINAYTGILSTCCKLGLPPLNPPLVYEWMILNFRQGVSDSSSTYVYIVPKIMANNKFQVHSKFNRHPTATHECPKNSTFHNWKIVWNKWQNVISYSASAECPSIPDIIQLQNIFSKCDNICSWNMALKLHVRCLGT